MRGIVAAPFFFGAAMSTFNSSFLARRHGAQDKHRAALVATFLDASATDDFNLKLFRFRQANSAAFLGKELDWR
jgi:hypothetical protein